MGRFIYLKLSPLCEISYRMKSITELKKRCLVSVNIDFEISSTEQFENKYNGLRHGT